MRIHTYTRAQSGRRSHCVALRYGKACGRSTVGPGAGLPLTLCRKGIPRARGKNSSKTILKPRKAVPAHLTDTTAFRC